jgi:hypothetical protein
MASVQRGLCVACAGAGCAYACGDRGGGGGGQVGGGREWRWDVVVWGRSLPAWPMFQRKWAVTPIFQNPPLRPSASIEAELLRGGEIRREEEGGGFLRGSSCLS